MKNFNFLKWPLYGMVCMGLMLLASCTGSPTEDPAENRNLHDTARANKALTEDTRFYSPVFSIFKLERVEDVTTYLISTALVIESSSPDEVFQQGETFTTDLILDLADGGILSDSLVYTDTAGIGNNPFTVHHNLTNITQKSREYHITMTLDTTCHSEVVYAGGLIVVVDENIGGGPSTICFPNLFATVDGEPVSIPCKAGKSTCYKFQLE